MRGGRPLRHDRPSQGEALLGYGDKVVSLSFGKMTDDLLPSQVEGGAGHAAVGPDVVPGEPAHPTDHEDKGLIFRMEGMTTRPR